MPNLYLFNTCPVYADRIQSSSIMATQTTNGNGYRYQTLQRSRNEIRLLKLLPADGNPKLKFIPTCHIFHAALHEQPKFVALSYVWGAATDLRMILVGNSRVRVTKNLYDAMMVLRMPKEETCDLGRCSLHQSVR